MRRSDEGPVRKTRAKKSEEERKPEPWAYIDTNLYWENGTNIIGTYGMVDFISDDVARDLTRQYRSEYTSNGRYLDINYYIIKVQSKIQNGQAIALYDDAEHNVLFDSCGLEDFLFQMDVHLRFDDSKDIVAMAKKKNKSKSKSKSKK